MNADLHELLQHIPSRDDLLRSIHRTTSHHDHARGLELVSVFGVGIVVGTAVALLFAPRSGRELRDEAMDQTSRLKDRVRDTVSDVLDTAGQNQKPAHA